MRKNNQPRWIQLTLLFLLLLTSGLLASDSAKIEKIDTLLAEYENYGQFNGSVLVAQQGKVLFEKGFGFANLEYDIPCTPENKFRLASLTKQFTAMLIMQLAEAGRLELNGRLSDYLPWYRTDTGEAVTLHHLLTHTSGIPNYTHAPNFYRDSTKVSYSLDDYKIRFLAGDLQFEPGSRFEYSNTGYFLLALVIEELTGKTWPQVLQEKILDPLGMQNTGVDHQGFQKKRETNGIILKKRAANYFYNLGEYEHIRCDRMENFYGSGDMYSTVHDLFLWSQALNTPRLLSPNYTEKMLTPYLHDYAYGWGVKDMIFKGAAGRQTAMIHNGEAAGINTRIVKLVEDNTVIIILSNVSRISFVRKISDSIINILYDQPYEHPKRSLPETLLTTINQDGISAGVALYDTLKTTATDEFYFIPRPLNRLGYFLISDDRIREAIEIFKLNVRDYPQNANSYDSLGEAYLLNGDIELAEKNYQRSLELNPENQNAVKMLEQIRREAHTE